MELGTDGAREGSVGSRGCTDGMELLTDGARGCIDGVKLLIDGARGCTDGTELLTVGARGLSAVVFASSSDFLGGGEGVGVGERIRK